MDMDENLLEGTISGVCSVIGFILLILAFCRERSFGSKAQRIVLALAWAGTVGDAVVKFIRALSGDSDEEDKVALCISLTTTTYLMQAMFNMFTLVFTPTYAAGRTNKAQILFIATNAIVYLVVFAEMIAANVMGEQHPQVKSLQAVLRAFFLVVGLAMLPVSFVLYKSFERWAILGPDPFVTYHLRLFVHLALFNCFFFLIRTLLPVLVQVNSTVFPRPTIAVVLWAVKLLAFSAVAYYLGFRFMSTVVTHTNDHSSIGGGGGTGLLHNPPSPGNFPKEAGGATAGIWPEQQVDPGTKESNFSLLLNPDDLDDISDNGLSSSFPTPLTPTSTPPRAACELLDSTRVSRVSSVTTKMQSLVGRLDLK